MNDGTTVPVTEELRAFQYTAPQRTQTAGHMRKDRLISKAPLFITTGREINRDFGSLSARVMNQRGSQALGPNVIAVSIDDFSRAKQAKITQMSSEMADSMLVGTKANLNV